MLWGPVFVLLTYTSLLHLGVSGDIHWHTRRKEKWLVKNVCQYNTCQIDNCEEKLGNLDCFNRAADSKATPPTQVVATTFYNIIRRTTVRNFKKRCLIEER